MNWYNILNEEEKTYMDDYVKAEGSLLSLAKMYNLSYGEVKEKHEQIFSKIEDLVKGQDGFDPKTIELIGKGEFSLELADILFSKYRN
ncbi:MULTISPECIES: hypothetical protein [Breznakia]|uniref:Uncharacterized protein n=1 Tax=Breznakia blatticola TaxID=1754012 RepID=A0A4R8A9M5_9FIRM|nr:MULTISPECIES: hypothetical protein [Breznakia]MDH6365989.1 hypothetical protein [Breznakia sp. PH1-1]MDH6403079.1 hypothetical protein [Breznakia sp. PF1-11]MDH6410788.1 hypothetical protein [Breznakia sp. PFB1-11]MDH6413155.1 hypothetical protein [Breznakia sp. PFB1-14]MDH6415523.1 hypothetical protein [Breznakia sp. PFB1-4]